MISTTGDNIVKESNDYTIKIAIRYDDDGIR